MAKKQDLDYKYRIMCTQRLTIAWLMKPKFSLILRPTQKQMQDYISSFIKKDFEKYKKARDQKAKQDSEDAKRQQKAEMDIELKKAAKKVA